MGSNSNNMEGRVSYAGLGAARMLQAGLAARSPEGTAAKGMQIKGNEDLWVEIQANTFRNWVNEHVKPLNMKVADLTTDLQSGVVLCALVEQLQGRPLRPAPHARPHSTHHALENVTNALNAIEADGVKLVNIGNVDIVNGNLKLILGLIWSLIVRYQIGRSKFPPRKLMLAWLQAVLPECRVSNLTTDWNSGILLSALLDYCKPGLFSHWRSLNPNNAIDNCSVAMNLAQREFGIPMILEPEYLSSPWLDELSGMTYLSYFMKPDSPGFYATLRWVNSKLQKPVANFTSDWNDGRIPCELIRSLGGPAPVPERLRTDSQYWEHNHQQALDAGRRLGVEPVLSARDMASKEVEHLGVMAYAAHFQWVKPRPPLSDMIHIALESTSGRVGEPMNFRVDLLSKELDYSQIKAYVITPAEQMIPVKLQNKGHGVFTPDKMGMHEIILDVDDIRVDNRFFFRVLPRLVTVAPPGMAPCAMGSLVEVLVNATGAPKREDIVVTAHSPSGRALRCPLQHVDGTSSAIFQPDEPGTWEVSITYQGKNIQGGPFTCDVFDPAGVSVTGLEGAVAHKAHYFMVDTAACGPLPKAEIFVDIVHDKRSIMCAVEKLDTHTYRVSFMPKDNGKHRIYVYYNGYDVKGSPFMMRVGSHKSKSKSTRESPARVSSPVGRYRESSPLNGTSSYNQDFSKTKSSYDSSSRLDESNLYKSSFGDDSSYNLHKTSNYDTTDSSYVTTKVTKTHDISSTTRMRSESPRHTSSPITSKYLSEPRPDLNRTSSPIYRTASPIGRTASPINRTESPVYGQRSSPATGGYSYNSTSLENHHSRDSGVEHSSNMRVSAGRGPGRRDSWDVINKTKHMMSANSLESLANMADSTLNNTLEGRSSLSPGRQDAETLRNTQYNRSMLSTHFQDTSREDFAKKLDHMAGIKDETDNTSYSYYSKNLSENRHQQSFLSSRPPQTTGGGAHDELDATHQRFRNLTTGTTSGLTSSMSGVSKKGGASSVIVKDIPNGIVGQPVEFEIDGSRAGSGNLEILVNGGRVTSAVRALGGQRFLASFTPHTPATHAVQITFNGETVPGSPWQVFVMSAGGVTSGGGVGGGGAVVGETTRLVPAREPAVFEVLPSGGGLFTKGEIGVTVVAPSKRLVPVRVSESITTTGPFRIEFVPEEVGTHIIEVSIGGNKLSAGPLIAKVYDSSLIQVSDVSSGVVGQPCQFKVDASAAGEGQLEISINEGEVPNHVQVVGGGRCLVSFTPEQARPHYIDIKFNGETVRGCPFLCNIADTGRVTLNLSNLELIPVGSPSTFQLSVRGGAGAGGAELAVAVRGPRGELPVRVAGDAHSGLTADFTPDAVGPHTITVEYNSHPVQGTPFVAKAYDARLVSVGSVSGSGGASVMVGAPAHFSVDASRAGEGNLEITIAARGLNIPTQVHPQGNARFSVSFVPAEACDHIVNVSFNKRGVPGCPMVVSVGGSGGGPQVSLPPPGPVLQPAQLLITHPQAKLEDIEVNVEGPNGGSVPASVLEAGPGLFKAEFVPRVVGEHRLHVLLKDEPCPGSPFTAKVYDVNAIKVKEVSTGTVGKPVTFLVETSQAGPGNLEVTVNGGRVPTSAQAQGQHTYAISFTPRDPTVHTVDLRFNGQDVPGSPFQCQVSSAARVIDAGTLEKVSVNALCEFSVESSSAPTVSVLGPARRPIPATVTPHATLAHTHKVSFTPADVGDHSIEVRLSSGSHVEGSPFLLKAYSAERVTVTDITPGVVGRPVGFTINASQAGAGNLEIIVAVGGKNVPNYVQSEGNARFKVNFKPVEAAPHSLSVRFNGRPVPGSPFTCIVAPPGGSAPPAARLKTTAPRIAQRGQSTEIQLQGFGEIEPSISVAGPGGSPLSARVTPSGASGEWTCRWTPGMVGRHVVSVQALGAHITGSPFTCNVYDVNRVRVTGLGAGGLEGLMEGLSLGDAMQGEVGKALTFSVDAASAGEGTLELVVSTQHSTVKAEVVACARGLYDVTFVPQSSEPHYVNITFNEASVPGSPFHIHIQESINHVQIGGTATIDLPTSSHTLQILGPDGVVVPHTVLAGGGLAEFNVSNVGRYTATATSPQGHTLLSTTINAFDSQKVKILSVGDAFTHRPAIVTLSVAEAGSGVLTARVRCAGAQVPHSVRSTPPRHELLYHPSRAAPHTITLLYNNVPISHTPLVHSVMPAAHGQEVTASGMGLYSARVGVVSVFSVDLLGRQGRELDVVVAGPGGGALPVRCYQTKAGKLQAEYTVNTVGQCTIEVLHLSKPVSGSPFTCQAYDPTKVTLTNLPQGNLSVHTPICFTVNHGDAGVADLDVSATGPQGQSVAVEGNLVQAGTTSVQLMPTTPGHYRIYVQYGGVNVHGSPLSVGVVSGRGMGSASSMQGGGARASGAGLTTAHVGKEAIFTVISPHAQPNVQIEQISGKQGAEEAWNSGGAGRLLDCSVSPGGASGEWKCSYIPLYVGLYEVRLSCPHQGPLPGSPWELKVIDTSQVVVVGGWALQLEAGGARLRVPSKLVFLTEGAGPGELQATLGGRPAAVETVNERSVITLNVPDGATPGQELPLELLYGGIAVAGAPRAAVVVGGASGTSATGGGANERVLLAGRGLATAHVGETAHFTIDGSQAGNGEPEVVLQSRSMGRAVGVALTRAGPALWRAAYTPPHPGHYLLRVLWDNRLVKGCPLSIVVSGGADASLVTCSGVGLSQGVVGREIRSWIDTRRAGPGELTAHCSGPAKVAYCELYEHGDATFTLNVKPQEAGRHLLTVKYAGEHVPGSPFTLRVAGAPDASKVRVYGPGIEPGVLATFQSRFICDTRGAGAGQLTVRVRGPKGAFRVEMQRESQKDRTILCKFDPTEPGDYRVEVKWAGKLVPGSPFPVMIFDTQEELRRYLAAHHGQDSFIKPLSLGYSKDYDDKIYNGPPNTTLQTNCWKHFWRQIYNNLILFLCRCT